MAFRIDVNLRDKLRAQYNYVKNLSTRKEKAIRAYTGQAYATINDNLLLHLPLEKKYSDIIEDIDTIFRNVPPTDVPIIVFRGVTRKHEFGILPGYISTSYDIKRAFEFADKDLECCIFVITIPVGSKVLPVEEISEHKQEGEILLPRSSNFKLVQTDNINGMDYFYLILDHSIPLPEIEKKEEKIEEKEMKKSKKLDKKDVVNLLIENTQKDEIDLFGLEEAVKMTASSLSSIIKTTITEEEIQEAINTLSK